MVGVVPMKPHEEPTMQRHAASHPEHITIRPAGPGDIASVRELAQLDSAAVPAEPVLLGELGGRVRAAVSLVDGSAVADPFSPTAHLVTLLRVHAARVAHPSRAGHRGRGRGLLTRVSSLPGPLRRVPAAWPTSAGRTASG
jgi:hypothetical protein